MKKLNTIIFFSILTIAIKAQSTDSTLFLKGSILPTVNIKEDLDTAKYLWNLLKRNQELLMKDTILFYSLDYRISYSDSSLERFKGIIKKEIVGGIESTYLCSGGYTVKNKIDTLCLNFMELNLLSLSKGFVKYKKFKRKNKIHLNNKEQWFELTPKKKQRKNRSALNKYSFKNRRIIKFEGSTVINRTFLKWKIKNSSIIIKYDNLKNRNIISSYLINIKYYYGKIKVETIFSIKLLSKKECSRNIKIDSSVTPYSLHKLLQPDTIKNAVLH